MSSLRVLTYNTQCRSWGMEAGAQGSLFPVTSTEERAVRSACNGDRLGELVLPRSGRAVLVGDRVGAQKDDPAAAGVGDEEVRHQWTLAHAVRASTRHAEISRVGRSPSRRNSVSSRCNSS